jgi:peptide/nickel transport system substrate-binding protein
MEGDTRVKDGVELSVSYATSVNSVRQSTQAVVSDDFESIGIDVSLEQVDAGIFFGGESGNEQNINHFYWDLSMYTNSPSSTVPVSFFLSWYAGRGDSVDNIAQESNGWQGQNYQRYANDEFDSTYETLVTITDLEEAFNTLIELNDILINDVVIIPEVNRAADKYAIANTLNNENISLGSFELNYWNVANWNRTEAE